MKQNAKHRAYKGLFLLMFLLTLGLYLILTFALTLPYNSMQSNVVQQTTLTASILITAIEAVELCVYSVGAALILFSAYRPFPVSTTLGLGGIYILTALLRYGLDLINVWMLYGTRAFLYWMLEPNLLRYIPYFLLDILFAILVMILACTSAGRYYRKHAIISKASVLLNNSSNELPSVKPFYPFCRIISFQNPLQRCTAIIALVLSLTSVVSDLIFVRYSSIVSAIGGYVADLLMGVIFYILCMFLFRMLFAKQEKFNK